MQRLAAVGFILTGSVHMLVLGLDAWPQVPAILSGALWTLDHVVLAVAARGKLLLQAEHALWSTLGSAGLPLFFVGLLILWIDRRWLTVPPVASAILVVCRRLVCPWQPADAALWLPIDPARVGSAPGGGAATTRPRER